MKKIQSAMISPNAQVVHHDRANKSIGRELARLEKELATIDHFENNLKNRMQDRQKFMSGKNARRKNHELEKMCKKQEDLRIKLRTLQELA